MAFRAPIPVLRKNNCEFCDTLGGQFRIACWLPFATVHLLALTLRTEVGGKGINWLCLSSRFSSCTHSLSVSNLTIAVQLLRFVMQFSPLLLPIWEQVNERRRELLRCSRSGGIFGILDEDFVYFCGLEIFTEGSFPELVILLVLVGGEKCGLKHLRM